PGTKRSLMSTRPRKGSKSTFKRPEKHLQYRHLKSGGETRVATVVVQTFPGLWPRFRRL
ncbi:MAG: hypothetical protein ACI83N_000646, partial [Hydrogenophaga sp.]